MWRNARRYGCARLRFGDNLALGKLTVRQTTQRFATRSRAKNFLGVTGNIHNGRDRSILKPAVVPRSSKRQFKYVETSAAVGVANYGD